jgi:hypothetical protein
MTLPEFFGWEGGSEGRRGWNHILTVGKYGCHFDGLGELETMGKEAGREGRREGGEDVDRQRQRQMRRNAHLINGHQALFILS